MYKFNLEKENAFCRDDVLFEIENAKDKETADALKKFDEECIEYWGEEWEKSYITVINEENWVEYAEEIFDDAYDIRGKDSLLYAYIDYEKFADDLKYDYTGITLGDTTFYGRD